MGIGTGRTRPLTKVLAFAGCSVLAALAGCSAFGAEDVSNAPPPQEESDAGGGSSDSGSVLDSASAEAGDDVNVPPCSGATVVLDDGFEAPWTTGSWSDKSTVGDGRFAIDQRAHDGNTSLLFQLSTSGHAWLARSVSGPCPLVVKAWIRVPETSAANGANILRMGFPDRTDDVFVYFLGRLRLGTSKDDATLPQLDFDTWTELVLTYDHTQGRGTLAVGSDSIVFNSAEVSPTTIEIGLLSRSDAPVGAKDEILFDDVSIVH